MLKHEDLMHLALDKLDFWHNLFVSKNVKYAMNLLVRSSYFSKKLQYSFKKNHYW